MNNDLISREALKKAITQSREIDSNAVCDVLDIIDNAPTFEEKIIELFNKYNILLVHVDGKIVPVKNTTKQECYDLLYDIQELIEWRKLLFKKEYTVENLQRKEGDLSGK